MIIRCDLLNSRDQVLHEVTVHDLVHLRVDPVLDVMVFGGIFNEGVECGNGDGRVLRVFWKVGGVDGFYGFRRGLRCVKGRHG